MTTRPDDADQKSVFQEFENAFFKYAEYMRETQRVNRSVLAMIVEQLPSDSIYYIVTSREERRGNETGDIETVS